MRWTALRFSYSTLNKELHNNKRLRNTRQGKGNLREEGEEVLSETDGSRTPGEQEHSPQN